MLQNEMRIRNIISVKYALELLMEEDDFLNNSAKKCSITQLKIPLANYIYYSCLESERIADEIYKCAAEFVSLVEFEGKRLESLTQTNEAY